MLTNFNLSLLTIMSWTPQRIYSSSYADLYLWRLFGRKDHGFYVDIGTCDEERVSPTKIFHMQRWVGVNLLQLEVLHREYITCRPEDTNILVNTGSPTSSDPDIILDSCLGQERYVPNSTLDLVFRAICSNPPSEVDFLRLNYLSLPSDVVEKFDLKLFPIHLRPSVIIITVGPRTPHIQKAFTNATFFATLHSLKYHQFFYDGLNMYFCDQTNLDDFKELCIPPNSGDGNLFCPPNKYYGFQDTINNMQEAIESLRHQKAKLLEEKNNNRRLEERRNLLFALQISDCHKEIQRLENACTEGIHSLELANKKLEWYRTYMCPIFTRLVQAYRDLLSRVILISLRIRLASLSND